MKKKLVLLVVSVMASALALCGCGKEESNSRDRSSSRTDDNTVNTTTFTANIDDNTGSIDTTTVDDYPTTTTDIDDYSTTSTNDEKTFEDYLNQPSIRSQYDELITQTLQQYAGMYDDMTIEAYGNTIVNSYIFAEGAESNMNPSAESQLQAQRDNIMMQLSQESGIAGPFVVEYVYYDSDYNVLLDVVIE